MTSAINRYYDPTTDEFLSIDPDVTQTDQPYVFTNDDPLNAEDPLGLNQSGYWIKGGKVYTTEVKGSHFLPTEGERYYIPKTQKGSPDVTFNRYNDPVDSKGNVWEWDGSDAAHAGPHYDVQIKANGLHTNVGPEGNVIGDDNFSSNVNMGTQYIESGGDGGDGAGFGEGSAGLFWFGVFPSECYLLQGSQWACGGSSAGKSA